ncbi:MAG: hypothetical protein J2P25_03385 [Nocardiopsaceae bacterium]|nr:hypothetical protein [Nocardiopsaceae bacterium]
MTSTAFLLIAMLALAAALIKAASMLRGNRPPGQGILLVLLLALAIAAAALPARVQRAEGLAFHDAGRILANITTMATAFSILALLITLGTPTAQARPKILRRLAALILCAAGMIAGFAWASPLPKTPGGFASLYATHPGLLLYTGLYLAYFAVALAELLIRSIRYAALSRQRPLLRGGLALMGLGSLLGLAYIGEKAWYLITQATRLPPPLAPGSQACGLLSPPQCLFSVTLPATAVVLAAAGATLPVWGETLAAPIRYYRNRRTLRDLEPLWNSIHDAFPQITLPGRGPRRDIAFRVYRCVIEIHDGRLLLRPHMSPDAKAAAEQAATARGLHGDDLRATIEAAQIAAALHARDHGTPAPAAPPEPHAQPDDSNISREAAWLARVSRAYNTPLVRDIARP